MWNIFLPGEIISQTAQNCPAKVRGVGGTQKLYFGYTDKLDVEKSTAALAKNLNMLPIQKSVTSSEGSSLLPYDLVESYKLQLISKIHAVLLADEEVCKLFSMLQRIDRFSSREPIERYKLEKQ